MPTIDTGYKPRKQQTDLHLSLKRFNVLVAHRRFGKTVFAINEAVDKALRCKLDRPRYAYIAPFRSQAKTICFDYLKEYTRGIPGTTFNESELRADLMNGARITLFGADNYEALRGNYFDGVILDEPSLMSPRVWTEIVRPCLSDRKGWAIFIGTPAGENQFYEIYQHALESGDPWYAAMYKASETGIIPEDELKDARRAMCDNQYQQEFECSFSAAVTGAVYAEELIRAESEGRITNVPWERDAQVHVSFDLGMSDTTALLWYQIVGREVHYIRAYEASGVGLDHYVDVIRSHKEYNYGKFLLPHDVKVRELGTGISRADTLHNLGINCTIMKRTSPEERIHASRMAFDRMWFDKENCKEALRSLRQYRYEWNDKARIFQKRPVHDWTSHFADSFGLSAEGLNLSKPRKDLPQRDKSWIV